MNKQAAETLIDLTKYMDKGSEAYTPKTRDPKVSRGVNMYDVLKAKQAADLSPGHIAREHVSKSDFALPNKHPQGHSEAKGKYPMPDKKHMRAALGFAAMHHGKGSAEYKAVERKAHEKFAEAFERGFLKAALESASSPAPLKAQAPAPSGISTNSTFGKQLATPHPYAPIPNTRLPMGTTGVRG